MKGKVNLNIKDDIKGSKTTLGNYELSDCSKTNKIIIENKDFNNINNYKNNKGDKLETENYARIYKNLKRF